MPDAKTWAAEARAALHAAGPIWDTSRVEAAIDALAALAEERQAHQYQLPDDLYPGSKDWRAGNYAARVEWLHKMYESKCAEVDALPELPPFPGHPEPHAMQWTRLERDAIVSYARAAQALVRTSDHGADHGGIARVEKSPSGPELFVHGVLVRSWLGCANDEKAETIAARINAAGAQALVRGAPRAEVWRPIETVPQCTPVLLCEGELVGSAYVESKYIGPVGASGYECETDFIRPTHWMPLPIAHGIGTQPEAEQAEGGEHG